MAKNTNPSCQQCRREGCKLFLKGERCTSGKCAMEKKSAVPGVLGASRKKPTEYSLQLREKQKVKRTYGLLEKQFKNYYDMAENTRYDNHLQNNICSNSLIIASCYTMDLFNDTPQQQHMQQWMMLCVLPLRNHLPFCSCIIYKIPRESRQKNRGPTYQK